MHVHNVSSYAPPGYKLARTEYDGGTTKHVFARVDDAASEIALECVPGDAAEERGYLEAFRDMHTPQPEFQEPPAQGVGFVAALKPTEADLAAMTDAVRVPAKPSRKRS